MRRDLLPTAAFKRSLRRYLKRHPEEKSAIGDALLQLEFDAFHPALRTHKLQGDLAGSWACSAGYDLRVVFDFVSVDDAEAILLLTVGTHDEVY